MPISQTTAFLWNIRYTDAHRAKDSNPFSSHGFVWTLNYDGYFSGPTPHASLKCTSPKKSIPTNGLKVQYTLFMRNDPLGEDLFRIHEESVIKDTPVSHILPICPLPPNYPHECKPRILGIMIHSCSPASEGCKAKPFVPTLTIPPINVVSHYSIQDFDAANHVIHSTVHDRRVIEPQFAKFFLDEATADINFHVDGSTLPAHTLVLQCDAAGPFFSAMLSHSMKEKTGRVVKVTDFSVATFTEVLRFIYTGRAVLECSILEVVEFYRALDYYQIESCLAFTAMELQYRIQLEKPPATDCLALLNALVSLSSVGDVSTHHPSLNSTVSYLANSVVKDWGTIQNTQAATDALNDSAVMSILMQGLSSVLTDVNEEGVHLDDAKCGGCLRKLEGPGSPLYTPISPIYRPSSPSFRPT